MKADVTITLEEYQRLKICTDMLGQIANLVHRFARDPETTTYQCVLKLHERERKLSDTVKKLKAKK
jgi:hypothetical protein